MGDFRTYKTARRLPAEPHKPVIDPAGWESDSLRDVDAWAYRFTERDSAELMDGIAAVRRSGVALVDIDRAHFPLGGLADILEDVRRELLDGRGVVRLRGFPVDALDREEVAIGYLGLGSYLGTRTPQNKYGHLLGHVKNLGGDRREANTRGYITDQALSFHEDSADFVGLLCVSEARSGGDSRLASSVTLYNRLLAERPDLIEALIVDFYKTRWGEVDAGQQPFYTGPIFAFVDGYFSAVGWGSAYDKAQALPGVPPYTPKQLEARPIYRRMVEELAIDMPFGKGDIQFLNNHVILHSRHAFRDGDVPSQKRHLMRLWLNDAIGRPIPEGRRVRRDFGVRLKGVPLIAPLDMTVPA